MNEVEFERLLNKVRAALELTPQTGALDAHQNFNKLPKATNDNNVLAAYLVL